MTEEVTVQIKGIGAQTEDGEALMSLAAGKYVCQDGVHFVEYEEMLEGADAPLHSMLRILPGVLTVERAGEVTVRMDFCEGQMTRCEYKSPYGTILLGIYTHRVEIEEENGVLEVAAIYDMQSGPERIPNCKIRVTVASTH